MLSPKMLKSKIHISTGGWVGGGGVCWQPTFHAESKMLNYPKFTFSQVGGGWGGGWQPTFDADAKI